MALRNSSMPFTLNESTQGRMPIRPILPVGRPPAKIANSCGREWGRVADRNFSGEKRNRSHLGPVNVFLEDLPTKSEHALAIN